MPCLRSRPLVQHALLPIAGKAAEHQHQDRVEGPFFLLGQGDHAVEGRRFRAVAAEMPSSWNTYSSGSRYPFFLAYSRMSRTWLSGEYSSWSSVEYPDIGGGNFQITGGHGVSPFTVSESGMGVANSNTKTAIMQSKRRRHLESR